MGTRREILKGSQRTITVASAWRCDKHHTRRENKSAKREKERESEREKERERERARVDCRKRSNFGTKREVKKRCQR